MTKQICRACLGLVLALAAATPAAAADKETRQMMADIRILQEQSQQLQNLIAAVTEAIKSVNARIDEQTNANRKSFADQKIVIDTVSSDLRVLREKVDDNNVRVGSLGQELDALRQSVTALSTMRAAAPSDATDPTAPPAPGAPAAAPPAGAAAIGASPQKLFDSAQTDYFAGQDDLAILGFESYLKTFPQSPQASRAQMDIGNSLMNLGKYDQAIQAFDTLIRTYPKAGEVPDAYVKKGISQASQKQFDAAREAFQYVIKTFPDSVAATIAQQRLQDPAQRP